MRSILAGLLSLVLFLFVGCSEPGDNPVQHASESQATWSWQNCYPTAVELYDICALDSLNLWVVGQEKTILHSIDGGRNWVEQLGGGAANDQLNSIKMFDTNVGWAIGSKIYHTEDGGTHWLVQNNPTGGYLSGMAAVSAAICYAYQRHGSLIKTTDAGRTWNAVTRPSELVAGICFLDEDIGWVIAGDSLYHTTNGGVSWTGLHTGFTGVICAFYDVVHGWVGGFDSLGYTTDGGITWQRCGYVDIGKVVPRGPAEAWMLGDNLSHTMDGVTWGGHSHGSDYFGSGIAFSGDSRMWVVGHVGYIARSDDSGRTWLTLSTSANLWDRLNAVDFVNDQTGWIVGSYGAVLHTTDAGRHWNKQWTPDSTFQYHAVDFVDEEFGWAVGSVGSVLSTTDGGDTWHKSYLYPNSQLEAVAFADRSNGWVAGMLSPFTFGIYHTSDGGASWTRQAIPVESAVNALFCTDALHAWASTDKVGVLYTTDGGNSWQFSRFPVSTAITYGESNGVAFTDNVHGCATFSNYNSGSPGLFRSVDGGLTWTAVVDSSQFGALCFADSLHGFALGQVRDRTGIWQTSNGGAQWDFFSSYRATGMKFVNPQSGWLVGAGYKIRHYGL